MSPLCGRCGWEEPRCCCGQGFGANFRSSQISRGREYLYAPDEDIERSCGLDVALWYPSYGKNADLVAGRIPNPLLAAERLNRRRAFNEQETGRWPSRFPVMLSWPRWGLCKVAERLGAPFSVGV